jgi:hypothetical protein
MDMTEQIETPAEVDVVEIEEHDEEFVLVEESQFVPALLQDC